MRIVEKDRVPAGIQNLVESARSWGKATARRTGRFDADDLCCGCAVVTAHLFRLMERAGYKNISIILNYQHVFMMWTDWQGGEPGRIGGTTLIIDPTASQIRGYDGALFAALDSDTQIPGEDDEWWKVEHILETVKDLRKTQIRLKWPDEQIAMLRSGPKSGPPPGCLW